MAVTSDKKEYNVITDTKPGIIKGHRIINVPGFINKLIKFTIKLKPNRESDHTCGAP
jgi:hypothetical protein